MNNIKKLLVVFSLTSLSACSYFYSEEGLIKDTSYDYLNARQTKGLEIPAPLVQEDKANYALVPRIGEKANKTQLSKNMKFSAPVQVLAVLDNVRLDKRASSPAVFIQEKKEFIWMSLLDLFQSNEITPAIIDRDSYYMNTGWMAVDERGVWLGVEGREEVDEFRAKYDIQIKPGNRNGDARLEVSRVRAQKINDDTDDWEDVPSYWQDSAEMLNLIISHYDEKVSERDREIRSRTVAGFDVELGTDSENNSALIASADKEKVWENLPKVLEAVNLMISDKDRRLMTYFLKYEKAEQGFFASLFSSETAELPIEEGNYQVSLSDNGELTAITFKDAQGAPLDSSQLVKLYPILTKLFGNRR